MYWIGSQLEADDMLEWDNWEDLTSGFFFFFFNAGKVLKNQLEMVNPPGASNSEELSLL